MATTANAGDVGNPSLIGSSHKEPAEALAPIATNSGVNKITKDLAAVDFDHTKAEVVHAVERLGEVIAGSLTGIGAAHQGRDIPPVSEFWAKKASASASSAFGKPLHDAENTFEKAGQENQSGTVVSHDLSSAAFGTGAGGALSNAAAALGGGASGNGAGASSSGSTADKTLSKDTGAAAAIPPVTGGPALYPTDGKTAPVDIKINEPQSHPSEVRSEAHKAGHTAPALTGAVAGASTATSGTAATSGTTATSSGENTTAGTNATGDKRKSSFLQRVKSEIKGDNPATTTTGEKDSKAARDGLVGPPEVAAKGTGTFKTAGSTSAKTTTTPSGTASKATGASALGVNSGSSSSGPPTTPKKPTAASTAANGTPGTPADGYKTATSTPSDTPDRQRKKSGL